jgi:F1F0 ATPase subunit 2
MADIFTSAALGAVYGAVLAAGFLAILWFSVRRSMADGGTAGWMVAGIAARLVLVIAAGYVLIATHADAAEIVGVAIGFTAVRMVVVSRTKSSLR